MKASAGQMSKAVSDYLAAREAKSNAEETLKQAENAMRLAMASGGTDTVIVDGVKVSITAGRRPSYDIEKLKQMIKPNLFKTLIKNVVDGEKFKAAIKLGTLPTDIADACTEYTEYSQIRVTQAVEASQETSVTAVA